VLAAVDYKDFARPEPVITFGGRSRLRREEWEIWVDPWRKSGSDTLIAIALRSAWLHTGRGAGSRPSSRPLLICVERVN
jgi:hypothetical protein